MAYTGVSIVDYLKSVGQDSSMNARKKLAQQYGVANYSGTATQNTQLLKILREGAKSGSSATVNVEGSTSAVNAIDYLTQLENSKPGYAASTATQQAADMLAGYERSKPGEYKSAYEEQLAGLLEQALNKEQFTYDMHADPLYQQYRQQYMQGGKMAMMDTMANAASLTGGYGSSYASTAGNQAYQSYLTGLNNVIPELYDAAYGRYKDDYSALLSQVGLLQGQDEIEYGRHSDLVDQYYQDLSYYYTKYGDLSDADYNKYINDLGQWAKDREYYYSKQMDNLKQSNWEKEFALEQEKWAFQQAQAAAKSSGGSGGSSKKSGGSSSASSSGSAGYGAVQSSIKNMSSATVVAAYIKSAVSSGKITKAEGAALYKNKTGKNISW